MTNLVAAAAEAHFGALADRDAARVVVDIGEVDAVTTHAMTLMLKTVWAVKERGGMMVFASAAPAVRRVFERCGLDIVLDLAPDVAAAVKFLRSYEPGIAFPQLPPAGGAGGGIRTQ